jgi:hypothetical protein
MNQKHHLGVPRSHPDYMKLYRAHRREELNTRARELAARPEAKAKRAAYKKKYDAENKERNAAYHKEKNKKPEVKKANAKASARWAKNNPSKVAAINAERYASKKKRTASWANKEAIEALYEDARQLTEQTGVQHHVDHIIPLHGKLVSGLHVENNLQVITQAANCTKSNKYEVA